MVGGGTMKKSGKKGLALFWQKGMLDGTLDMCCRISNMVNLQVNSVQ
jgi:hypothetical protein